MSTPDIKTEFSTPVSFSGAVVEAQEFKVPTGKKAAMSGYIMTDELKEVMFLIKRGKNIWLTGPAGSGKSSMVREACRILGYGFERINMNGHTTDEHFIGGHRIHPDPETKQPTMYWMQGILERAMRHGLDDEGNVVGNPAVLLIDEISAAPPETLFVLQRVLEDEKELSVDTDGARLVKAHPKFVVVAADNTQGTGDTLGGYGGLNMVNFATRDRFKYMIPVDYNTRLEKKILARYIEDNDVLKKFMNLTSSIRKENLNGSISFPMGIRRLIAFGEAFQMFGDMQRAFRVSVLNFLEPDQQAVVREMYQRHTGTEL